MLTKAAIKKEKNKKKKKKQAVTMSLQCPLR